MKLRELLPGVESKFENIEIKGITCDSRKVEEGFLFFQRRIKHIVIRNGYNIYPDQIEEVLQSVDSIANVCVVGVDDEENHTQIVRAVVILKPGADPKQEESVIRAQCLQMLPRYAVPGQIVFVSAFPQNPMGKTDRKELGKL